MEDRPRVQPVKERCGKIRGEPGSSILKSESVGESVASAAS